MMPFVRVLLPLLLSASALAAEPEVRSAGVGDLVVIDATSADGQSLTWHAFNAPSPRSYLVCDGGKRLVFSSSRAGAFTFLEVAAKADGSGGVAITLQEHRVTVTGATPPPADPGTPAPPVSRFGLESRIRAALLKVPADNRLDPKTNEPLQGGLRVQYLDVVARIDKGEITTPGAAMNAVRDGEAEVLGDQLPIWRATFGVERGKALKELADAGTLKTLEDHRQALFEIATGLTP